MKQTITIYIKWLLSVTICMICGGQLFAALPTLPAIPTTCDYSTAPAAITLTKGTEPSGVNTTYLLI